MRPKTALKIILVIGLAGLTFSGYLSYWELFRGTCQNSLVSCGTGAAPVATYLKYPACVYGFFMYLLVTIISILGLVKREKPA